MLRLQMESQPLRYDLAIQPAKMQLQTQQAKLQIETEPATVEITASKGKLLIDHTPWRYSLGIKNNVDFVKDAAAEGKQAALEAIARLAQQGRRLADISGGGNAIAQLAKESTRQPQRSLTFAPLAGPDISYEMTPVRYNSQPAQLRIHATVGSVSNETQPGSVSMQITQYPSLRMWTTGSLDMKA